MAKFAPVVPVHMAAALQTGKKDYLGDYHLLLAHDVIDKPKEYGEVYGEVRRRYKNAFIIMDNSICELGKAVGIKDLLRAHSIVPSDCIVIPDAMGDGPETRAMAIQFVRDYSRAAVARDSNFVEMPPLLGVIQGDTKSDALSTFMLYYTLPGIDFFSVPRVITTQQGSRMPVLLEIQRVMGTFQAFKGLHLLGFSDNILDDVACARMPFIQGIDSAVPIRAALKGMSIWDAMGDSGWSSRLGKRGDFWELPIGPDWQERAQLVHSNIDLYRSWVNPILELRAAA